MAARGGGSLVRLLIHWQRHSPSPASPASHPHSSIAAALIFVHKSPSRLYSPPHTHRGVLQDIGRCLMALYSFSEGEGVCVWGGGSACVLVVGECLRAWWRDTGSAGGGSPGAGSGPRGGRGGSQGVAVPAVSPAHLNASSCWFVPLILKRLVNTPASRGVSPPPLTPAASSPP